MSIVIDEADSTAARQSLDKPGFDRIRDSFRNRDNHPHAHVEDSVHLFGLDGSGSSDPSEFRRCRKWCVDVPSQSLVEAKKVRKPTPCDVRNSLDVTRFARSRTISACFDQVDYRVDIDSSWIQQNLAQSRPLCTRRPLDFTMLMARIERRFLLKCGPGLLNNCSQQCVAVRMGSTTRQTNQDVAGLQALAGDCFAGGEPAQSGA